MGLLGDNTNTVEDRVANIVIKVFDRYDIEPGELNQKMDDTIELVRELAPVIQKMETLSGELDNDISNLRDDVNSMDDNIQELQEISSEFNETGGELSEQLERTADSFENFNEIIEEAVEEETERRQ